MVKVKIVGAGGYGGVGAAELLTKHPQAEIVALIDVIDVGRRISDLYPHLLDGCDLSITHPDDDKSEADFAFFATPDGVCMKSAASYLDQGYKIIDYSGDFRFNTSEAYAEYASRVGLETEHAAPDLLAKSAYGLCECHRDEIQAAQIVGNPGCFAVSAILGALPAIAEDLVDPSSFIFDAKTGVSGAGKRPSAIFHFPHRYEEMNAYKIGAHQHVIEVERELGIVAKQEINVTFTAQVVPIVRGIMTTVYARMHPGVEYQNLLDCYRNYYHDEPFVHVFSQNDTVGNRAVRGTNKSALWINLDRRTNTMIVMSHIDNLVKGQAGSAVQNMNVMCGIPETTGLELSGMYP
jgi:N-acetyl-gamma-glutamyl-phosphate reductase